MTARFACPRYALSALTSHIRKRSAVRSTSSGSCGLSAPLLSVTVTEVTTFVVVPIMACALSHVASDISLPYFSSHQRR